MKLSTSFKYICTAMALLASPSAAQSSIAFVTSTQYNGNLGGLSGADAICQDRADAVGLPGTYMAWLSVNSIPASPSTRFYKSLGPYTLVDGTILADDWDDLIDGSFPSGWRFQMDEFGNLQSSITWTNTNVDGTPSDSEFDWDCNGWTSSSGTDMGLQGRMTYDDGMWTKGGGGTCEGIYHIYCFQQLGQSSPQSQASSQLTANTWAVNYQGDAAVDFTSSSTNEVVLSYFIGAGQTPVLNLYASADCSAETAIDVAGVATPAVVSQVVSDDSSLDTLTVGIDIDKAKIVGSNIWDALDSSLEFCLAVTLESGGMVITEDLQTFDIAFNFDVAFSADTFAATADSAGAAATAAANVDDYISACKCDGTTCNTSALGPDDLLQVCVMSSSSDTVVVSQVTELDLLQAVTSEAMAVVDAGANAGAGGIVNAALSEMTGNVVKTVVPARFFTSTDAISVSGNVLVEFAPGRRQLVAFGYNNADGRMMLDSPFDSNNPEGLAAKDSAHHIHLTVDPPTQEAEGSFDFEVGVEMATDESKKFNAAATLGITKVLVGAVLSLAYLW